MIIGLDLEQKLNFFILNLAEDGQFNIVEKSSYLPYQLNKFQSD